MIIQKFHFEKKDEERTIKDSIEKPQMDNNLKDFTQQIHNNKTNKNSNTENYNINKINNNNNNNKNNKKNTHLNYEPWIRFRNLWNNLYGSINQGPKAAFFVSTNTLFKKGIEVFNPQKGANNLGDLPAHYDLYLRWYEKPNATILPLFEKFFHLNQFRTQKMRSHNEKENLKLKWVRLFETFSHDFKTKSGFEKGLEKLLSFVKDEKWKNNRKIHPKKNQNTYITVKFVTPISISAEKAGTNKSERNIGIPLQSKNKLTKSKKPKSMFLNEVRKYFENGLKNLEALSSFYPPINQYWRKNNNCNIQEEKDQNRNSRKDEKKQEDEIFEEINNHKGKFNRFGKDLFVDLESSESYIDRDSSSLSKNGNISIKFLGNNKYLFFSLAIPLLFLKSRIELLKFLFLSEQFQIPWGQNWRMGEGLIKLIYPEGMDPGEI